jgi:hypothetical protein
LSLELVADCAGRGLEDNLGVVGRRPLIVDIGMGLRQGLNEEVYRIVCRIPTKSGACHVVSDSADVSHVDHFETMIQMVYV